MPSMERPGDCGTAVKANCPGRQTLPPTNLYLTDTKGKLQKDLVATAP